MQTDAIFYSTVKHCYSEHVYNELTFTAKIFISRDFITCCKLDGYNELCLYNKVKFHVSGTSFMFYCTTIYQRQLNHKKWLILYKILI